MEPEASSTDAAEKKPEEIQEGVEPKVSRKPPDVTERKSERIQEGSGIQTPKETRVPD